MREAPQPGQVWRHTPTGGLYLILHLGKDRATDHDVVIYQNVASREFPGVWVRTLSNFMGIAPGRSRQHRFESQGPQPA